MISELMYPFMSMSVSWMKGYDAAAAVFDFACSVLQGQSGPQIYPMIRSVVVGDAATSFAEKMADWVANVRAQYAMFEFNPFSTNGEGEMTRSPGIRELDKIDFPLVEHSSSGACFKFVACIPTIPRPCPCGSPPRHCCRRWRAPAGYLHG